MPVEEFQRLVPDFDIFMPSMGSMAPYNILYIFVAGIILPYAAFSIHQKPPRTKAHAQSCGARTWKSPSHHTRACMRQDIAKSNLRAGCKI